MLLLPEDVGEDAPLELELLPLFANDLVNEFNFELDHRFPNNHFVYYVYILISEIINSR